MIGIYDSGVGGFTVLRSIRELAPDVDIVYFGDTINAPYANRDQRTLEWLTLEAFRFLKEQGATQLVSACNSVSASVVRPLLDVFGNNGSIIEMVGPTAQYVNELGADSVMVIATPATIRSQMYQKHIHRCIPLACPHLSGLIECGGKQKDISTDVRNIAHQISTQSPDVVVLGCTHYPYVIDELRDALMTRGCAPLIIDPSDIVATTVIQSYGYTGSGKLTIHASTHTSVFERQAHTMFHTPISVVAHKTV